MDADSASFAPNISNQNINLNNFKNKIEDYYFNLYDIVDISTVFKNDENDKDYKIKQNKGFSLYNYEELNQ